MTVPALADLMNGRVTLSSVRKLNLDDLLGREAGFASTPPTSQQMITGRVVLVTGAGGLHRLGDLPAAGTLPSGEAVFFDHNEFGLYRLVEEFETSFPGIAFEAVIGDVKDAGACHVGAPPVCNRRWYSTLPPTSTCR